LRFWQLRSPDGQWNQSKGNQVETIGGKPGFRLLRDSIEPLLPCRALAKLQSVQLPASTAQQKRSGNMRVISRAIDRLAHLLNLGGRWQKLSNEEKPGIRPGWSNCRSGFFG
jgi:hypothetical protein